MSDIGLDEVYTRTTLLSRGRPQPVPARRREDQCIPDDGGRTADVAGVGDGSPAIGGGAPLGLPPFPAPDSTGHGPGCGQGWRPRVSVVIPALNEARNLPWVLGRLPAGVDEVILVDGRSTDDTVAVARAHCPGIRVVGQGSPGKGAALASGLLAATGDILVMIDADGSMDPGEIPAFVGALVAGADVVKGSRYVAGAGSEDLTGLRSIGNRALGMLANLLLRTGWSELCYGYAAMWADAVDHLAVGDIVQEAPRAGEPGRRTRPGAYGHGFEIEAVLFCRAARAGLRVTEVASLERQRRHGESNLLTFRDGLRVLGAVLHERRRPPRRVAPRRGRTSTPARRSFADAAA